MNHDKVTSWSTCVNFEILGQKIIKPYLLCLGAVLYKIRPYTTCEKRRYDFLVLKKGRTFGTLPYSFTLGLFWGVLGESFGLTTSPLPEHEGGPIWCGTLFFHPYITLSSSSSSLCVCVALGHFPFPPKYTFPFFLT